MMINHKVVRAIIITLSQSLCLLCCLSVARGEAETTFGGRVRALAARAQTDSALSLLDSVITADPGSLSPLLLKSELQMNAADTAAGISTLDAALQTNPAATEARLLLARIRLTTGDAKAALRLIEEGPPVFRRLTEVRFLEGEAQQALGHADSALALYRRTYELLAARDFPDPPLVAGQDIAPFQSLRVDGSRATWSPGKLTLFLLWSRYCPKSESALAAVPERIKQAAVSWNLIPINSEYMLSDTGRNAVAALAKHLGYKDTLWFDDAWQLVRHWSVDRLPCLVLVGPTGSVLAVYTGWNDSIKAHLSERYLGPMGDTAGRAPVIPDSLALKGARLYAEARDLWSRGQSRGAIRMVSLAVRNRPDVPLYHAQLASYLWQSGDSAGARLAIAQANRVDSMQVWSRISRAVWALSHEDWETARELLETPCDSQSPSYGRFMATRALVGARMGQWEQTEDDLAICRTIVPFDLQVAVAEALLAEASRRPNAITMWHDLVADRLANTR